MMSNASSEINSSKLEFPEGAINSNESTVSMDYCDSAFYDEPLPKSISSTSDLVDFNDDNDRYSSSESDSSSGSDSDSYDGSANTFNRSISCDAPEEDESRTASNNIVISSGTSIASASSLSVSSRPKRRERRTSSKMRRGIRSRRRNRNRNGSISNKSLDFLSSDESSLFHIVTQIGALDDTVNEIRMSPEFLNPNNTKKMFSFSAAREPQHYQKQHVIDYKRLHNNDNGKMRSRDFTQDEGKNCDTEFEDEMLYELRKVLDDANDEYNIISNNYASTSSNSSSDNDVTSSSGASTINVSCESTYDSNSSSNSSKLSEESLSEIKIKTEGPVVIQKRCPTPKSLFATSVDGGQINEPSATLSLWSSSSSGSLSDDDLFDNEGLEDLKNELSLLLGSPGLEKLKKELDKIEGSELSSIGSEGENVSIEKQEQKMPTALLLPSSSNSSNNGSEIFDGSQQSEQEEELEVFLRYQEESKMLLKQLEISQEEDDEGAQPSDEEIKLKRLIQDPQDKVTGIKIGQERMMFKSNSSSSLSDSSTSTKQTSNAAQESVIRSLQHILTSSSVSSSTLSSSNDEHLKELEDDDYSNLDEHFKADLLCLYQKKNVLLQEQLRKLEEERTQKRVDELMSQIQQIPADRRKKWRSLVFVLFSALSLVASVLSSAFLFRRLENKSFLGSSEKVQMENKLNETTNLLEENKSEFLVIRSKWEQREQTMETAIIHLQSELHKATEDELRWKASQTIFNADDAVLNYGNGYRESVAMNMRIATDHVYAVKKNKRRRKRRRKKRRKSKIQDWIYRLVRAIRKILRPPSSRSIHNDSDQSINKVSLVPQNLFFELVIPLNMCAPGNHRF